MKKLPYSSCKSIAFIVNILLYSPRKSEYLPEGQYKIESRSKQIVREDEFIAFAADQARISPSQFVFCMEIFTTTILRFLKKGDSVDTPWFNVKIRANGILKDSNDHFNPEKNKSHHNHIGITLKKKYLEEVKYLKVPCKKEKIFLKKPIINLISDIFTSKENVLFVGQVATVFGQNFYRYEDEKIILVLSDLDDKLVFQCDNFKIDSDKRMKIICPKDILPGIYKFTFKIDNSEKIIESTYSNLLEVI
ncbi:MAG: DNA-binding domain-containing protein [Bacteroidales bacterium]